MSFWIGNTAGMATKLLSSPHMMNITRMTSTPFLMKKNIQSDNQSIRSFYNEAETKKYFTRAKYGGRHMITVLPGDGIGPEMVRYVREMFQVGGFPVDFEEVQLDSHNEDPENMIEAITSILRNGAAIKGNIETREHSKYFLSRNVELRLRLNLFVNVVHCKSNPGIKTRHKDIDIILIRQNTEGEYSCLEHESVDGVVESLKIVTREKTEQVARYAFDYARSHNRKKLTCVHKANIMKMADGLFLKVCTEIAKEYPDIEFNNMIIDNCSMQLVSNPNQFDVLLLPNLYGNILTNIACGLVGGPGITSGRNYGPTHAVFETGTRNTGKKVAGKNVANPIAMLNASVDLLDYLQLESCADIVRDAIYKAINIEKLHTLDMGGNAKTSDVVNFIIDEVNSQTKIKAYQARG
ncbi:isocitrate dehydrogenase (NAD(+)) 3 non-catalytic subunit gamma [Dermatophagoides pteronyssinus]|uniref:Isocitrate dehydrogenase [NAD] subunit gamma 1, mitochondrial n=2 Tax=Dermatophagoides pteronyssinus TaxID=6956 RepID=A0ABQ8JTK2_DERPT|nr:isocitrate dehydrogenase [NAD] subunit gamma, mitochondrial-like [Dermatophagoides pteronyssinus]KAH9425911.1 Isocitrate dehydrogenase [NAD] subunit gamma 1, mitochondrial [Dermatophagoides pteronyssinus]